ncbi:MAG: hypothetical protein JO353_11190 [Phycisphaerae bacterium]|nr:hypothetical protein [Phycisphaerae bacterium]
MSASHNAGRYMPVMQRLLPKTISGIVDDMKQRYGVRIRRWRSNMSGCAWSTTYTSGMRINWIESPYPRTPISLAIFLHEVGHHAIGFNKYKRRCEEEYHVWMWALEMMRSLGVEPDEAVERRFDLSVRYAVDKAVRRGMVDVPAVLNAYVAQPAIAA